MSEYLDKLSPPQVLAALAITCGAVVLLVFILAVLWYQLQSLSDQTVLERERQQTEGALKKELLKRELSPADLRVAVEALALPVTPAPAASPAAASVLRRPVAPAPTPGPDGTELLRTMAIKDLIALSEDVAPGEVEELTGMLMSADRAALATAYRLLADLAGEGVSGARVFAAVRAVCRATPPAAHAPAPMPGPTAAPPRREEIDLEVGG